MAKRFGLGELFSVAVLVVGVRVGLQFLTHGGAHDCAFHGLSGDVIKDGDEVRVLMGIDGQVTGARLRDRGAVDVGHIMTSEPGREGPVLWSIRVCDVGAGGDGPCFKEVPHEELCRLFAGAIVASNCYQDRDYWVEYATHLAAGDDVMYYFRWVGLIVDVPTLAAVVYMALCVSAGVGRMGARVPPQRQADLC